MNPHFFVTSGGNVLADVVGADRQFAMTAIDKDGELHSARPPDIDQGIHRCARRAARVEHVVDEHDRTIVDIGDAIGNKRARLSQSDVVAVEPDVDRAEGNLDAFDLGDAFGQPSGEMDATRQDAYQNDVFGTAVAFADLVRDASEGARNVFRVEDDRLRGEAQVESLPRGGGKEGEKKARTDPVQARRTITLSRSLPGLSGPAIKGLPNAKYRRGVRVAQPRGSVIAMVKTLVEEHQQNGKEHEAECEPGRGVLLSRGDEPFHAPSWLVA